MTFWPYTHELLAFGVVQRLDALLGLDDAALIVTKLDGALAGRNDEGIIAFSRQALTAIVWEGRPSIEAVLFAAHEIGHALEQRGVLRQAPGCAAPRAFAKVIVGLLNDTATGPRTVWALLAALPNLRLPTELAAKLQATQTEPKTCRRIRAGVEDVRDGEAGVRLVGLRPATPLARSQLSRPVRLLETCGGIETPLTTALAAFLGVGGMLTVAVDGAAPTKGADVWVELPEPRPDVDAVMANLTESADAGELGPVPLHRRWLMGELERIIEMGKTV